MSGMDRDLLLDALTALTNTTVKSLPHNQTKDAGLLTVSNFLSAAAISYTGGRLPDKSLHSLQVSGTTYPWKELLVDMEDFYDPQYDYDFRDLTDSSACSRGGEPYTRPVGWYRFAVKVKNKYSDGNAWLGSAGWRSSSSPGEWPVSFHGTGIEAAKNIAAGFYKPGSGMLYGRGIYSTPKINIAEEYTMSKTFTSTKNGKVYKTIMQNRINPQRRKMTAHPDYWLIPVPENITEEQEKMIVEASIRPYGILIQEVSQQHSNTCLLM